ncbi:MAG: hypothetical protein C0518_04030 [Opitutus sp.]|nr:hypothetical protein [Opitutus sp.]
MTAAEIITLSIAGYGAITGTAALALQWAAHRTDRAQIKISASMAISSNLLIPTECYSLQVDIVNRGRRVARIAEIFLDSSSEKQAGARFVLFDSQGNDPIALEEGQSRRIEERVTTSSLDGFFESLKAEELISIRLTTGEVHRAKFYTVKKSKLAELRGQQIRP